MINKRELTIDVFKEYISKDIHVFSGHTITESIYEKTDADFYLKVLSQGDFSFMRCTFEIPLLIEQMNFLGRVTFEKNIFSAYVEFKKVNFKSNFTFRENLMNSSLLFKSCEFQDGFRVIRNESKSIVIFDSSDRNIPNKIKGKTNYYNNKFPILKFKNVEFGAIDFSDLTVEDSSIEFNRCIFNQIGLFRKLNFNSNTKFINSELSNCSFLSSNINEAIFGNCRFNFTNLIDERIYFSHRNVNYNKYSNLINKSWDELTDYEIINIIEVYRSFEIKFDNQKDYENAGEFHKKRFELERKNSQNHWLKYFLLCVYKWSSNYGENYTRALEWFIGFFVFFTFLYLFSGLSFTDHNGTVAIFYLKTINQFNFWNDLGLSAIYSLNNVIPFKKDLTYITAANGWTTFFTIIESFILTILASLFVIGLRRKFKR